MDNSEGTNDQLDQWPQGFRDETNNVSPVLEEMIVSVYAD